MFLQGEEALNNEWGGRGEETSNLCEVKKYTRATKARDKEYQSFFLPPLPQSVQTHTHRDVEWERLLHKYGRTLFHNCTNYELIKGKIAAYKWKELPRQRKMNQIRNDEQ